MPLSPQAGQRGRESRVETGVTLGIACMHHGIIRKTSRTRCRGDDALLAVIGSGSHPSSSLLARRGRRHGQWVWRGQPCRLGMIGLVSLHRASGLAWWSILNARRWLYVWSYTYLPSMGSREVDEERAGCPPEFPGSGVGNPRDLRCSDAAVDFESSMYLRTSSSQKCRFAIGETCVQPRSQAEQDCRPRTSGKPPITDPLYTQRIAT